MYDDRQYNMPQNERRNIDFSIADEKAILSVISRQKHDDGSFALEHGADSLFISASGTISGNLR